MHIRSKTSLFFHDGTLHYTKTTDCVYIYMYPLQIHALNRSCEKTGKKKKGNSNSTVARDLGKVPRDKVPHDSIAPLGG